LVVCEAWPTTVGLSSASVACGKIARLLDDDSKLKQDYFIVSSNTFAATPIDWL
jgi:hypothetical protein